MPGFDKVIDINCSAAQVYELATDLDHVNQWIPQIIEIKKNFDGAMKVGDTWEETRVEGKRSHTLTLTVYELHSPSDGEAPFVHCVGSEIMGGRSYYRFVFEPIGESSCRVRLEARLEVYALWQKILGGLMMQMMKRSDSGLLQRLKTACEFEQNAQVPEIQDSTESVN